MTADCDVLTVTLNPAIDETVFVHQLQPGTVHRATRFHRQAGGKGINVAAMLATAGHSVAVTGFLGQENPRLFDGFFRDHGLHDAFIRLRGETRTGIKIIDEGARETTDLNLPGLLPGDADMEKLEAVIEAHAQPGRWVVFSGSLPKSVRVETFAKLVRRAKEADAFVAVDTSGPALKAVVDAGLDLVKPNKPELAEILGRPLDEFGEIVSAAEDLRRNGIAHVVVSLGSEGALFLSREQNLMAGAPPVAVVSTVGAGDALLAGYLSGLLRKLPAAARARQATVFAWSALESLNRHLPPAAEREARASRIPVQMLPQLAATDTRR